MNLFQLCNVFFIKKGSFPAKTGTMYFVIFFFLFVIISPYQRNTIQTLLFKLFDKLIRLELVEDS